MPQISEPAGSAFRRKTADVVSAAACFVRFFEGFSATSYRCPAGVWTIGYGTTHYPNGHAVAAGEGPVTREIATNYLEGYISRLRAQMETHLLRMATVNQAVAMLSLAYNIGIGNFLKSSVLRYYNQGKLQQAADAFLLWNRVGGSVSPGLKRRRKAERRLFLKA